jgi:MoaA/NifB/PqqE/SkfB family radical SAM enzyme
LFTVEDQKTSSGKAVGGLGKWTWRALTKLGKGPQSLAIRLGRRPDWFLKGLTPRKAMNVGAAVSSYLTKQSDVHHWPLFVVVDLSPLCNLHCTVCVHAHADGREALQRQSFSADQRMSIENYTRLIDEIKNYSLGIVPWYIGDPIVYPDLLEVCRITAAAGMNCNVSTNLSRRLSDDWLEQLVRSGLSHLTVCVDGMTQETYEKTRVGGRLEWVLDNLRRICNIRRKLRKRYPRIEVQYIKYQHNLHELPQARREFEALGIEQFHELWGWLHNYTDRDPGNYDVFGPRKPGPLPRCHWLHLFTLVRYDGDVLPCCAFRLGEQYVDNAQTHAVGNAFRTSLRDVWTSPAYQQLRRLACDPPAAMTEENRLCRFCDACPRVFDSNYVEKTSRFANEHDWEEYYRIGPEGRTERILSS